MNLCSENDVQILMAKPCDAKQMLFIYSHYVKNTAITFEYNVPSVKEFRSRIKKTIHNYPWLKAVLNEKIVGYAYANVFKPRDAYKYCVEVTVYVLKDERQKGIGKKLYSKIENILLKMNVTNMNACITFPDKNNDPYVTDASFEFHKKMGFSKNAEFHKCGYKFNNWYDMIWMEKIIGEHKSKMNEFIPFFKIKNQFF